MTWGWRRYISMSDVSYRDIYNQKSTFFMQYNLQYVNAVYIIYYFTI